jgi:hypothetical protein
MKHLQRFFAAFAMVVAFTVHAMSSNIEHVGPQRPNELASTSVAVAANVMTAARLLLPSDWAGFAHRSLDARLQTAVSIKQGEPWVPALDRWLAQNNLTARLDWQAKRFYLQQGQGAAVNAGSSQSASGVAVVGQYSGAPTGAPPVTAAPLAPTWDINLKDIHLGNTFARWGQSKGWTVIWDAPKNIMIEATSVFTGELPEAINQVLSSPGIANSAFPLEACVYPNTPPLVRITLKGEQEVDCK